MSARNSASLSGAAVQAHTRYLVDLVLPSATFEIHPTVTFQTLAELDLDAHRGIATLLAWKPTTPRCAGAECFPIYPVPSQPLPGCRLMVAHFADKEAARRFIAEVTKAVPCKAPPWSEATRAIFHRKVHEEEHRS